ncbi:MAG TPA: hypothetical protein VNC40_07460 [Gaiellaceae bacterium]|nr:hypothetical protein [Gaiellaceae bacterium]
MDTNDTEREEAIAATDESCPRCGSARLPAERYCLDCGLELPEVTGTLASLRRRWIRRIGWYPGDWVWIPVLTLPVAMAGAASAIVLTTSSAQNAGPEFAVTPAVPVTTPSTTTAATTPTGSSTLPTAPEPTTPAPTAPAATTPAPTTPAERNGRLTWPAGENGWTVVLVSYPSDAGTAAALATATRAAQAGLPQVGTLDSSSYASLQPGYIVVFTGLYTSKNDADAAVSTARQAGFGGAYSRQIAR